MDHLSQKFTLIVCFFLTIGCTGSDNDALVGRFKREAPKAWRKAENMLRNTHFTIEQSFTKDGKLDLPSNKMSVFQNGDEVRIFYEPLDKENIDSAYHYPPTYVIRNQQYSAMLTFRDFDNAYQIEDLYTRDDADYYEDAISKARPGLFLLYRPLANSFIDLPDFKKSEIGDGYRVVKALALEDQSGSSFVKLILERVNVGSTESGALKTVNAELVLDPQRYWSIVSFEEEAEGKSGEHVIPFHVKIEVDYHEVALPHPKSHRKTTRAGNEKAKPHIWDSIISEIESAPNMFISADHRLPAFGLTEPEKLKPRKGLRNKVVYALLVGLFVCVLIYFFSFRKR